MENYKELTGRDRVKIAKSFILMGYGGYTPYMRLFGGKNCNSRYKGYRKDYSTHIKTNAFFIDLLSDNHEAKK